MISPVVILPREIIPASIEEVSKSAFYALNWLFFAFCIIAFSARMYVRYVCFHRLLLEDYFMVVALVLHTAEAIIIQLLIHNVYNLQALADGDLSGLSKPGIWEDLRRGTIVIGLISDLTIIGVLLVKINFMLFFRRLGKSLRWFMILWWAVLLFTIGSTVAVISMQRYLCTYSTLKTIFSEECTSSSAIAKIYFDTIFSAAIDAFSDLLIIGFPIAILWKSGISVRKKIILTFIFCCTFLTIAITIVRGTIFHSVYGSNSTRKLQNPSFTIFWFYIEFSVAFIIACMVSFRTLFVHRKKRSKPQTPEIERRNGELKGQGPRRRVREWMDSLFEACVSLEGRSDLETDKLYARRFGLPEPPLGLMTVDFHDDDNWRRNVPQPTSSFETQPISSPESESHVMKPQASHSSG